MKRFIGILLLAVMTITLFAACSGNTDEPFDADKAFERLRTEVKYEAELQDAGDYAEFVFGEAVNGGEMKMYQAGGKLADTLMLFKVKDEADLAAVEAAVNEYIASAKLEADRYNPSELTKVNNAIVYKNGLTMIVCITADTETANGILY